ncbi:response regulator [Dawidia soli]|uniref:Response regulator n=1 Tax=Dawidia soli TaxID=2782352 RepID=A0AAP2DAP3_9BACT|nr:response regulator [Dawidia soli]MBT1688269.1 response regulator [Dawidia soli]
MTAINVLIVEDKVLIAEDIAAKLRKHGLEVAGIYDTGEEAMEAVKTLRPDLVLMDIELAGAMDGISAAHVMTQEHDIPVIYLSDFADPKTLDRAKKTQPANYLTKPFNENELVRAIDIAFTNANTHAAKRPLKKDHVFLREDNQVFSRLKLDDILYLKAERAYCNIVTEAREHTFSTSMNHIWDQLGHDDFVRAHRSYVVNLNRITSLDGNVIHLGKKQVQMSDGFREEVLGRLKIIR